MIEQGVEIHLACTVIEVRVSDSPKPVVFEDRHMSTIRHDMFFRSRLSAEDGNE